MDLDGDATEPSAGASEPPARQTRRRGEELERAILEAAWDELDEAGYAAFTFERVAARARTSRAVLYRRWSTRAELVRAAVRHRGVTTSIVPPDTGSLREDMLGVLRNANDSRRGMWTILSIQLADFFTETRITPAELREDLIGGQPSSVETVMRRAIARGEARDDVPTRVLRMPFDIFRSEAMLRLGPVPEDVLVGIVDDLFLPLVRA